jgi:microcystin-dependent protein
MTGAGFSRLAPIVIAAVFGVCNAATPARALDAYLGEVGFVGAGFCPEGWLPANGRLLPISEYTALFALLGTKYGGDGTQTFGLPNLETPTANPGAKLTTCIAIQGIFPSRP